MTKEKKSWVQVLVDEIHARKILDALCDDGDAFLAILSLAMRQGDEQFAVDLMRRFVAWHESKRVGEARAVLRVV